MTHLIQFFKKPLELVVYTKLIHTILWISFQCDSHFSDAGIPKNIREFGVLPVFLEPEAYSLPE